MILSAFYIGYMITHIPGGILAEKFGGKYTLSLGILSTAVFTILTPFSVEYGSFFLKMIFFFQIHRTKKCFPGGYKALIVLRILMGLGEGTTFPALSVLLASWVPETERSKLGSFVFGGGQVSSVFSYFSIISITIILYLKYNSS